MPSIKLSQIIGAANSFLGSSRGISQNPKAAAVDLLKKNPLELDHSKSPTAHLTRNPLELYMPLYVLVISLHYPL